MSESEQQAKEHRCQFCKTEFDGAPRGRCGLCGLPRCPGCTGCLGYC